MNIVELPITRLTGAQWNSNIMDDAMVTRLRESITRFGLVGILVVRLLPEGLYEVLSGNQRLGVLAELGHSHVPCVLVDVNDAEARLLSQALNHIQGDDDLGLRAELLRDVLRELPQDQLLSILPESADSLSALTSLGQQDMADHLVAWQSAQKARLRHLQVQLTDSQLEVVEEALSRVLPEAREQQGDSPNVRGTAIYLLCKSYLEREDSP
ncbi:MAG: ParB N-terminal domain-containing protein [Chloroflexi bacterium]|nr:ParB N-terminal domain-containing protein [Chloroflexota bacterium]